MVKTKKNLINPYHFVIYLMKMDFADFVYDIFILERDETKS